MRRFLLAVMLFGAASGAGAADMPDLPALRGAFTDGLTTAKVNWQGYYVGGQGSYGSSNMNFNHANDLLAVGLMPYSPLKDLIYIPGLGKSSSTGAGFGGFVGYNSQWEDVLVGVEASFTHGELNGSSTPTPFRYTDGFGVVRTQASSTASVDMKDYGSLRLRGGYTVNCFVPYLFGGVALGRADINRSVSMRGNFDPLVTANSNLRDHFMYGYAMGFGVDAMLFAGLFARLEYEYQRFTSPVDVNISTVRAGLGYKF